MRVLTRLIYKDKKLYTTDGILLTLSVNEKGSGIGGGGSSGYLISSQSIIIGILDRIAITNTGANEYRLTLTPSAGATDLLDRINGLTVIGTKIVLIAAATKTITVQMGNYMKINNNFSLSANRRLVLEYIGGDKCVELSRSENPA